LSAPGAALERERRPQTSLESAAQLTVIGGGGTASRNIVGCNRKMISLPSSALWTWMQRLGPLGPGLLGIADSAPFFHLPPGTLDVALLLLCAANHELWAYYALMTSLGTILGGFLTYRIAEKGGHDILVRKFGAERADEIHKHFEKLGFATIFGGAIAPPGFPFGPVQMAAGVVRYPRKKFFTALAAGRGLRFFSEAFLGRTYSRQMIAFFSVHSKAIMIATVAFACIGALIYSKYFHRPAKSRRG
jgi:membrane protein YqaA with SNARE-associated domain